MLNVKLIFIIWFGPAHARTHARTHILWLYIETTHRYCIYLRFNLFFLPSSLPPYLPASPPSFARSLAHSFFISFSLSSPQSQIHLNTNNFSRFFCNCVSLDYLQLKNWYTAERALEKEKNQKLNFLPYKIFWNLWAHIDFLVSRQHVICDSGRLKRAWILQCIRPARGSSSVCAYVQPERGLRYSISLFTD